MDDNDQSEIQMLQMELENVENKMESIGHKINQLLSQQELFTKQKEKLVKKIHNLEKCANDPCEKLKDWNSDTFPWSDQLKENLTKHFHITQYRTLQKETMNVTLSNKDCMLIMPTGGGKSLTFQLPALMSPGFTLVCQSFIIGFI